MNFRLEDAIAECLKEKFNLEKGDSGFCFSSKIRDMTFYNEEYGTMVEITYKVTPKDQEENNE